jgi:acetyl esterase
MDGPLDPDCARALDALPACPPWHALSVAGARRLEDDLFSGGGPELAAIREIAIEGPARGDLPLRVYRPDSDPAGVAGAKVETGRLNA